MNQHSPLRATGSLLERAAELYGFGLPAARPHPVPAPEPRPEPKAEPLPEISHVQPKPAPEPVSAAPQPKPKPAQARSGRTGAVDRARLREAALIEPDAPVGPLAEEFRIVKRQLLLTANAATELPPEKRRVILLCSAQPDEGKTFCALNLALSLAGEKDTEVLLVDADFPKPEILSILGLEAGPGLVDAIADPAIDPESLVVRTDLKGLSVLAAGRQADNVTELLASERTREVLERLSEVNPKRLIIFDSPPALVASPATFLAAHAGQLVMVVRADKTTEAELRDALELLSGCERVSLLLNGTGFAAGGRRFGAYYGYGQ
ncbi:MAG: protein-tyrosine kinase [Sphingomonadales bacterium]|nr:protein-tyrosine kinase [Sphingomonadales bacterium]